MRHITDVHAHVLNYMYLYVLKIKHVSLHKCVLNLLICPRDEKLVVVVGLKQTGFKKSEEEGTCSSTIDQGTVQRKENNIMRQRNEVTKSFH